MWGRGLTGPALLLSLHCPNPVAMDGSNMRFCIGIALSISTIRGVFRDRDCPSLYLSMAGQASPRAL